jgi:hypothetical protein
VSARWRNPPRLKPGEEIRLAPDGPVYTVETVSDAGAAIATKVRRVFTAHDKEGNEVEVTADGRQRLHISAHSFVYRESR